jgi:flagellar motor switch protein FliM
MPKILNQYEVDALMDLVQASEDEAPETQESAPSPEPSVHDVGPRGGFNVTSSENVYIFDFKRPERVSTEQLASIEALHEGFARNLSSSLSGYLRTVIDVRLVSVEQFTYSEFTMSVPSPTIFTSLSCKPLSGNVILEMNPSILFPFIDRLLGGGRVGPGLVERPFTQIEIALINTILHRIMGQLEESWQAIETVRLEIEEVETNPMLMQIVAPNEPVLLLSFEVVMGKSSGFLNYCIPFKVIEPIIEEFTQTNWFSALGGTGSDDERSRILGNIRKAPLDITVTLAEVDISLSDLLTMKPGDVLDCGIPATSNLMLSVGAEKSFLGRPGTFKRKKALLVNSMVERSVSQPPAKEPSKN